MDVARGVLQALNLTPPCATTDSDAESVACGALGILSSVRDGQKLDAKAL